MGLVWFSDGIGKKVAPTNLLAEARCNNHRFSVKVALFLEGHISFFVPETLPSIGGVGVGAHWAIKSTSEPLEPVGRVERKGILQQKRAGLAFRNEIQAWWNILMRI